MATSRPIPPPRSVVADTSKLIPQTIKRLLQEVKNLKNYGVSGQHIHELVDTVL